MRKRSYRAPDLLAGGRSTYLELHGRWSNRIVISAVVEVVTAESLPSNSITAGQFHPSFIGETAFAVVLVQVIE